MGNDYKLISFFNKRVGEGNWFWLYKMGEIYYSWDLGMQFYEDAYWIFFRNNLILLKELVKKYGDVFEFNKKDMDSGLDYRKQLQRSNHYQDIAIRRCLRRFGIWFKGDRALKLPGSEYDEDRVPFHLSNIAKNQPVSYIHQTRMAALVPTSVDKYKLSEFLIR
jgi:hypothetical protein